METDSSDTQDRTQTHKTNIIILGVFRSGTSLIAKILSCLGVNFGPEEDLIGPNNLNPTGYFQRSDILLVNNGFIDSAGSTLGLPAFPPELLKKGDRTILEELDLSWSENNEISGLKDPRFCATLYAWIELGLLEQAESRIVHITRNLEDSIISASRHPYIDKIACNSGLDVRELILRYSELAEWHIKNLDLEVLHLHLDELLSNPAEEVARLANFVGCDQRDQYEQARLCIGMEKAKRRLMKKRPLQYIYYASCAACYQFKKKSKKTPERGAS